MCDAAVRQLAYLKQYVVDTLERQQDGVIDKAQAAALLWNEVSSVHFAANPGAFDNVASLRIAGEVIKPDEATERGHPLDIIDESRGKVVAVRYVGPRPLEILPPSTPRDVLAEVEMTDPIMYVDFRIPSAWHAAQIVRKIEDEGFEVRDWTFGCHRR